MNSYTRLNNLEALEKHGGHNVGIHPKEEVLLNINKILSSERRRSKALICANMIYVFVKSSKIWRNTEWPLLMLLRNLMLICQ
jgi:hypothetical protein